MIYLLLGVMMSGQMVLVDIFPNKIMCENAKEYVNSLDKREAHVYCVKM